MTPSCSGKAARVWRRPDGKPVCEGEESISAAHTLDITFAVARAAGTACDLEAVTARTAAVWRDLLGGEKFKLAERMARERGEGVDAAATRLWTAWECLKKIGQSAESPLMLEASTDDGWMELRSGRIKIMTCVTQMRGMELPLGVAVAFEAPAPAAK